MVDNQDSNLVDPASSHMLVSRLSHACLSINEYTVKLRTAHSNSYRLFDICFIHIWIPVVILELIHALRGTSRNPSIIRYS